ncbi:hypothetical protein N8646_00695 [bacterium]|nr:hypothetical protein [bacterium]
MVQNTSSPIKGQEDLVPPPAASAPRGLFLKVCAVILTLATVFASILFWIYGTDTHHASRSSIWWTERGRNLIPPTATDITLRQDFLDHYATYTVSTKDLNTFLQTLDSGSDLSPVHPDTIGKAIGPLGWRATEDTVSHTYVAGNGGAHDYYHDTKSGLTYQSSAYW